MNSQADSACAPMKKIDASTGVLSIVHTKGNPTQMVANRRGTSDHILLLFLLLLFFPPSFLVDVADDDGAAEIEVISFPLVARNRPGVDVVRKGDNPS